MGSVSVMVAGTDIYCGDGKVNKCSPFPVTVRPGPTTHERSYAYGLGLTDSVAGSPTTFTIQAKDAYGNNRWVGDEEDGFEIYLDLDTSSVVQGPNTTIISASYRGDIEYLGEYSGKYKVSYTAEKAGTYNLRILY